MMSQFGSSKNPPWSSLGTGNTGGHHQVMQSSLMGLNPSAANLYNQQMAASAGNNTLAMQAQMQANAIQQAALQPQAQIMPMQQQMGGPGANSQLNVSYPSTGGRQTQGNQPKQRVFMGTVTKLHDTFGFIDEDVFFQTSTVKGSMPKVGEKVLVEATFNPNMPFKWNATRVQHLNQASSTSLAAQQMGAMNQMQQSGMMNMGLGIHNQGQGLLGNPPQAALNNLSNRRTNDDRRRIDRNREREDRERLREQQERDNRDRKRDQRDRGEHRDVERKEREKERERSPVKQQRSRSPRRSPKRVRKPVPRYVVQVPRFPLDIKCANVLDVKKRYPNLYTPSDYFLSDCCYQEAFPLGRPFKTAHPCNFHLMSKDVAPVVKHSAVLEPPDISYQYSAKVMLLASVSGPAFFQKCCARTEDPPEIRENFQHPARILSFLVGTRSKNEVMAIGGPWSPSLDGPDPANDKSVLIRTAIRTTKALTGIDLSGCGQWFRFLEIRYHRGEQKGRPKPRVETVVIFVPDVWNIMPTQAEWATLSTSYKDLFTAKYVNPPEKTDAAAGDGAATNKQQEDENDASMEEEEEDGDNIKKEKVCTPWKELDPKTMKVQALRDELDGRSLNSKGLKTQLVARLTKAIKKEEEDEVAAEQEQASQEEEAAAQAAAEKLAAEAAGTDESAKEGSAEDEGEEDEAMEEEKKEPTEEELKEMEEKRKREEKERLIQEKKYTLPEEPAIVVHPSATAKGGKFDCTVTNLSVLLDYRPEDTKEHSFEVSLFAELFNELLQRDFAFNIYQALEKAPEKKEEKKEKKKDDKKDEKKDDKKDAKKEEKTDGKTKKEEKEGEKGEEKKDEVKKEEGEENGDEPKEKKRKVEDAAEEQPKADETKEEVKDKKEETKEKTESPAAAGEDAKKEEKKKDEKGTKAVSKRSSSQEAATALKAKTVTLDPNLLLSCVYFDQNHCGYIMEKDLEDLLNCMGLNLSRAQVRKLTQKVISRDSWPYRKLTDGVKEEASPAPVKEEVNGTAALVDPYKGNISLLESLRKAAKPKGAAATDDGEDHLVMYEGAVVDLASTMARVRRSEQQRRIAESKIGQLQKETDKWKNVASSSQESLKTLNLSVDVLKKELHDSEGALRATKRKNEEFRGCVERAQRMTDEMSARFKAVLAVPADKKPPITPVEKKLPTPLEKKPVTPVEKKPPTPVEKKPTTSPVEKKEVKT